MLSSVMPASSKKIIRAIIITSRNVLHENVIVIVGPLRRPIRITIGVLDMERIERLKSILMTKMGSFFWKFVSVCLKLLSMLIPMIRLFQRFAR